MIKKDKIHFNLQHCNSFNATYNFIWSARESGKTTQWVWYAYKRWKKEQCTTIILRYLISDITDSYIGDLIVNINNFLPDEEQIKFRFAKGQKSGIVDVFIEGDDSDIPLFRCIALSNPISRIKSQALVNAGMIIFDEFILNTRCGEKYDPSLVTRLQELYNTYLRHCHTNKKFKLYCFGNPYSKYHPLLSWLGVDYGKIKTGVFIYNKEKDYYLEAYMLKQELKDYLLAHNPLYKSGDETYTRYAFNGEAINDSNFIIVPKQPQNYVLRYVFRMHNKFVRVFIDNTDRDYWTTTTGMYWVDVVDDFKTSNRIFAVDFANLIENCQLITPLIKDICFSLRCAIVDRNINFKTIECGYYIEELYTLIK